MIHLTPWDLVIASGLIILLAITSLPGLMTGQILSGTPPVEAVKYQILIFFLISAGTGFGIMLAVWMIAKRLFDDRQRLKLDILHVKR